MNIYDVRLGQWVRFDMHWVTCPRETTELQEHCTELCVKWRADLLQEHKKQYKRCYTGWLQEHKKHKNTHHRVCYLLLQTQTHSGV